MNNQSMGGRAVTVEWCVQHIVEPWDIHKLHRLKGLIEKEIMTRLMTGKHPSAEGRRNEEA